MKKIILIGFSIIFFLIGTLHLLIESYSLASSPKIWRHGGGEPQNEIQSALKSIESGYEGIEINIFFKDKKFYLRKDKKDLTTSTELLEDLLTKTKDLRTRIWLDLKPVEIGELLETGDQMKNLFKKHQLMTRSFVETKSLLTASLLKIKGVPVVLWFEEKNGDIKNMIYKTLFSLTKSFFKIKTISYDIRNAKSSYLKDYKSPVNIFTVNDEKITELNCQKRVRIILTDLSFEEQKIKIKDCPAPQK